MQQMEQNSQEISSNYRSIIQNVGIAGLDLSTSQTFHTPEYPVCFNRKLLILSNSQVLKARRINVSVHKCVLVSSTKGNVLAFIEIIIQQQINKVQFTLFIKCLTPYPPTSHNSLLPSHVFSYK